MSPRKPSHPIQISFDPQPTEPPDKPQRKRRLKLIDETRASNVALPVKMWEWVDEKHAEARREGGAALRKAAILRAVFQVVMSVRVDLTGCHTEEEIAERIKTALRQ